MPQLYGPDAGFLLALVTIGGLPHSQISVSTAMDHNNDGKFRKVSEKTIPSIVNFNLE